jgi:hypothetical protein
MTWDTRFASLKGPSRKWLSDDLEDDHQSRAHADEAYAEDAAGHDGWAEIVPRGGAFARLADALGHRR